MKINNVVIVIIICSVAIFSVILASKTTQSPNGASEGKKATLTPAIIVRSENGKIKAYWGFKKTNCGNPVYNPKDSITENFLLIADSKQILFTK